jgi:glycosyltransferase involved in cell wall biosynthesis
MNLLHVVPTYVPAWSHGGPIYSVHGLCRSLVERGHRVSVFTTDVHGTGRLDVPLAEPVDVEGVEASYFPVSFPRRLYRSPGLARAVRERVGSFDAVHLHSLFLWPTASAARAAERAGVPYVIAPRGMLVPELVARQGRLRKQAWLRLVERRTLRHAAAFHATTELEALEAGRFGLPLPPIHVVPNGIDLAPFRDPATPESPAVREWIGAGPFFLFLGRVNWKKGLDRLILALLDLPAVRLAVAGPDEDGHRAELEELARWGSVGDRVRFLGPVHGGDKLALLRSARALVLPSTSENFANAVLESMASGRPVIVTPDVGLAPTVQETGCGLVVAGNPQSLEDALKRLLEDSDLADEMGRRGCEAAQNFAWSEVAHRMAAVYEEIARSSRQTGAGG